MTHMIPYPTFQQIKIAATRGGIPAAKLLVVAVALIMALSDEPVTGSEVYQRLLTMAKNADAKNEL